MTSETEMLELAISKMGRLLHIGFGTAGAEIIAKSLSDGGDLDPMIPGCKVEAIFAFCDIRDFTFACEAIEEDVMLFVNKIASITHRHVVEAGGAPNKIIGDAFLFVWKLSRSKNGGRSRLQKELFYAALSSVNSILAEISKLENLYDETDNKASWKSTLEDFQVRVGFGLHSGCLPFKLRNISFGGLFQSSGSASVPASAGAEPLVAGSRSDTTGSQQLMQPLPGAGMGPPLETNSTHTDSNLLVETALAPSTSLFNFFGLLGRGTSSSGGDVGGKSAGAASASAGAASAAGAAAFAHTGDDDRKPAAASAAASLEKSPRRRAKCLTAATADARAVVETQAAVRETSLTRDISSFLPSFLERGFTGLVATATTLGTGISGVFGGSSGDSMPSPRRNGAAGGGDGAGVDSGGCISQITQGGGALAAAAPAANAIGVGSDDLVVPPPPRVG